MAGTEEKRKKTKKKSKIQIIASQIAGLFGIGFYNLYYVEKNLLNDIEIFESQIEVEIRKATDGDIRQILKRLDHKDRKNFEYNIAIESTCHVATHKNKIAGFSWANLKYIYIDGMKVAELPAKGSYHGDTYVFPEFRGNKILLKLVSAVYADLKKAGCIFTGTIIAKNNATSIATTKKFHVKFQTTHILRLPGPKSLIIGKRFLIGISSDFCGTSR